uniref:DUF8039 domain-containing protein n=1 Tax=Setaria viridis TaxID=4556 RepID=A0A4U6VRS9_SETVI|nr:hypothetical protein SEVIR_2G097300v2 [Setaria viridis]
MTGDGGDDAPAEEEEEISEVYESLYRCRKKKLEGHTIITEVDDEGAPIGPPAKAKELKKFAFKKMEIAFQTYKKNLHKDFIKKGIEPDLENKFQKLAPYWDEFKKYKLSEDAKKQTTQATENTSKKKYFHHLGQGGYKTVMPKWQRMEDDLMAKGIVLATLDWPLRAKNFFYAHGSTLNRENGSFITTDSLIAEFNRLQDALKAKQQGSFKPDREKDELTYALRNLEHSGPVRGMGVVPWKKGFSEDKKLCVLEEQAASSNERMDRLQETLALSQAGAASAANVGIISPTSQRRSSIASTEFQLVEESSDMIEGNNEHYPMDDTTVRTLCELLTPMRKTVKVVAHCNAEVPVPGGIIHGVEIPKGYARVQVDRVETGWKDLDFEILIGNGETELGYAIHTWICWDKRYIRFLQVATVPASSLQSSRHRSPTPPSRDAPTPRDQSMSPLSPPDIRDHSMSPPLPQPPLPKKKNSKDRDYFRGPDDIWIEFESLWYLYHQDALDKSLISAWIKEIKEELIAQERLRAIQEQLCGFLLEEVVNPKGEFYDDGTSENKKGDNHLVPLSTTDRY